VKLPAHPVKTGQARQGLPGNVEMITGSAFLPAYLPQAGKAGHPADLPVKWPERRSLRKIWNLTLIVKVSYWILFHHP
jgi:hypothetical protein